MVEPAVLGISTSDVEHVLKSTSTVPLFLFLPFITLGPANEKKSFVFFATCFCTVGLEATLKFTRDTHTHTEPIEFYHTILNLKANNEPTRKGEIRLYQEEGKGTLM